jgi:hypothetical protein
MANRLTHDYGQIDRDLYVLTVVPTLDGITR